MQFMNTSELQYIISCSCSLTYLSKNVAPQIHLDGINSNDKSIFCYEYATYDHITVRWRGYLYAQQYNFTRKEYSFSSEAILIYQNPTKI